jgi:hypothetical protein
MRIYAFALVIVVSTSAAAQEPLVPAVEQADDAEVPHPERLLPPPSPPREPARTHAADVLLPPAPGWQYRLVDGPPVEKRRWGLFTAGIVTFGGVWLANVQAGIPTGDPFLYVPLVGPLMEISRLRFDNEYGEGNTANGWLAFLLVTDAAAQIGGFAMMIAGASTTSKKPGAQRIELVPLGAGAAVRGTF